MYRTLEHPRQAESFLCLFFHARIKENNESEIVLNIFDLYVYVKTLHQHRFLQI
jgi:hypothetical protein